ncbi:hypothetical protein ACQ4M4_00935 [Leptolyngbya sp. AN02str]
MSRQQDKLSRPVGQASAGSEKEEFDFDRWAGAVKRQMIDSLKRRGSM